MLSQHAAGMQQYKLPGRHQLCMTRTQHAAWHDGKRQTQHSCLRHAASTTVSKAAPPHRHVQKCRQPLRHVATAAAATADMGGPFRLPRVKSPVQLRNLLQPSEYDAELLSLAVPALAAMTLEPLMNVFSAAVLGHLGTQQLGAVSLASLATSLATYVFSFLVFLTTPRIAAAHANGERQQVARLAAVGLWLAAVTGVCVAVGINASAGAIVAALKPPEAEVTAYAVQYISVRSWGILAAMLGFVASGTYRGVKDTRTPLYAASGAAITHVILTPLMVLGMNWGVWGAGLAATISQWVSCTILVTLMFHRKLLSTADLVLPPQWQEVVPYLWKGAVLAFRMLVTFGMIMFASAICVQAGAASQAAFEIIRQVWIISIQLFESLNVATQAVAAGFLGKHDRDNARRVLKRAFNLSCAIGLAIGLVLFVAQAPLVNLFTKDAVVASLAGAIMPIIAFFMPLDAGASIMDGGLIAAGQTNALSVIQVLGSLVQYAVLAVLIANSLENVVSVWGVLKISTLARMGGGYWLHFMSSRSAYREQKSLGQHTATDSISASEDVQGTAASSSASSHPTVLDAHVVEQSHSSSSGNGTEHHKRHVAITDSSNSSYVIASSSVDQDSQAHIKAA